MKRDSWFKNYVKLAALILITCMGPHHAAMAADTPEPPALLHSTAVALRAAGRHAEAASFFDCYLGSATSIDKAQADELRLYIQRVRELRYPKRFTLITTPAAELRVAYKSERSQGL